VSAGDHAADLEAASFLAGQREPQPDQQPIDGRLMNNGTPGSMPGVLGFRLRLGDGLTDHGE
jgi:hypothetical protein